MLRTATITAAALAEGNVLTAQDVAILIRDHLLSLPIAGGERIFEAQISRDSGVSRPVVREACRLLEADGLLDYTPNRGYSLKFLSRSEVTQLIEFRVILEEAAFVAACRHPERERIAARLREAFEEMQQLPGTADAAVQISADLAFHRVVIEETGNAWLIQSFDRMSTQMRYAIRLMSRSLNDFKIYSSSHETLIACCRDGEVERMRAEIRSHIMMFLPTLLKRLRD